jgi:tetratricopeptide (TPR) repeat protein
VLKFIEKKEIKILMGTIYMNMKQYKAAIDCFREVLSQRPINESVKVKLAICLEEYGNYFFSNHQFSDALTCYNESLNYDNRISVINNQGLAYQNINNFADAEKCFNEVLRRDSKNIVALNNLASLYRQIGNIEKSKQIF